MKLFWAANWENISANMTSKTMKTTFNMDQSICRPWWETMVSLSTTLKQLNQAANLVNQKFSCQIGRLCPWLMTRYHIVRNLWNTARWPRTTSPKSKWASSKSTTRSEPPIVLAESALRVAPMVPTIPLLQEWNRCPVNNRASAIWPISVSMTFIG